MKRKFSFFYFVLSSLQPAYYASDGNFRKWFSKFSKTADARYASNRKYNISEHGHSLTLKVGEIKAYWTIIRKSKIRYQMDKLGQ